MKTIRENRQIWIALLGLLLIPTLLLSAACSGKKKGQDEQEQGADQPEGESLTLDEVEQSACNQFFGVVSYALQNHLRRESHELNAVLEEGFARFVDLYIARFLQESSSKEVEEVRNRITAIAGGVPSAGDCAPYIRVAHALKNDTLSNAQASVHFLRVFLYGALQSLDRFSSYDWPEELQARDASERVGAGIRFRSRSDYSLGRVPPYLVVEGFYPGSKNGKGELRKGDRIASIAGKKVSSYESFEKAVDALNTLTTENAPKSIHITTTEDVSVELLLGPFSARVAHFDWIDLEEGLGYFKIDTFISKRLSRNIGSEFSKALIELLQNGSGSPRGLILDLRGNGGGRLDQSRALLEGFLPSGSIISHHVSTEKSEHPNHTVGNKLAKWSRNKTVEEYPISDAVVVVLVDRVSASASEEVAAALQDYGKGIIIGETTMGKGISQTGYGLAAPLEGQSKVTTSYFYSPRGKSHHLTGVEHELVHVDPLIDIQLKLKPKTVWMKDFAEDLTNHVPEAPAKLTNLPSIEPLIPVQRYEKLLANLKKAADGHNPRSCALVPGDEAFEETDDCLLDWAIFYAKRLADLRASTLLARN